MSSQPQTPAEKVAQQKPNPYTSPPVNPYTSAPANPYGYTQAPLTTTPTQKAQEVAEQLQTKYGNTITLHETLSPQEKENALQRTPIDANAVNVNAVGWQSLDHPEYAGKYEVPQLPEGSIIRSISEDQQGLQVQYVPKDYPEQVAMVSLRGYTDSTFNKEVSWVNKNFPEAFVKAKSEYAHAGDVARATYTPQISGKEASIVARKYPELLVQQQNLFYAKEYVMASQKYAEEVANVTMRGGFGSAVAGKDIAAVAKNYPGTLTEAQAKYAVASDVAKAAYSGDIQGKKLALVARDYPELLAQEQYLSALREYASRAKQLEGNRAVASFARNMTAQQVADYQAGMALGMGTHAAEAARNLSPLQVSQIKQQQGQQSDAEKYGVGKSVAAYARRMSPEQVAAFQPVSVPQMEQAPSGLVGGVSYSGRELAAWAKLGHPEYAGKYPLPTVDTGGAYPLSLESALREGYSFYGFHEVGKSVKATETTPASDTKILTYYMQTPHQAEVLAQTSLKPIEGNKLLLSPEEARLLGSGATFGQVYQVERPKIVKSALPLAVVGTAIFAPEVLPVTLQSMVLASGLSVGFSEVASYIGTGKPLTVEQAELAALTGEAFALGSAGVMMGVAKVAPTVASSILGRAGVSMAIGAGSAWGMSGGDIRQAGVGALSAAAFSGLDYAVAKGWVPVPKLGVVSIPLEGGGEVTWKGLYLSRGEVANPLVGRMSKVPEGAVPLSHGPTGEGQTYVPVSNIETAITGRVLEQAGYSPESVQAFKDVPSLWRMTENVRNKYVEDILPTETRTLSESGVSTFKEYALQNKDMLEEIGGSFATKPQVSKQFEYVKGNVGALRTPGDVDVYLKAMEPTQAQEFTNNLVATLNASGEIVRVSPEEPMYVESFREGDWRNAIQIHYKGEPVTEQSLAPSKAFGSNLQKPPIIIEDLPALSAVEQSMRKGVSILGFEEDQTLGPVAHRMKDIPDFFQVERSLLESGSLKVQEKGLPMLERAAEYYGVAVNALEEAQVSSRFTFKNVSPYEESLSYFYSDISPKLAVPSYAVSPLMISSSPQYSPNINVSSSESLSVLLGKKVSPSFSYALPSKSPSSFPSLIRSSQIPSSFKSSVPAYSPSLKTPSPKSVVPSGKISPSTVSSQMVSPPVSPSKVSVPSLASVLSYKSPTPSPKVSSIVPSPILSPSEYPSISSKISPSLSQKTSQSYPSVLSVPSKLSYPSPSPSKASSIDIPSPSLIPSKVPSPSLYPSPSYKPSPSPYPSPSLAPSPYPTPSPSPSPSPYPSPIPAYSQTSPPPKRKLFIDDQRKKQKHPFGKAWYTSVFRGWPVRTPEQVLKLNNRNIASELRRPDMGKPSTKKLKSLIAEEKQASRMYRGMGYSKIAKQETQHRRTLQRDLAKKRKRTRR